MSSTTPGWYPDPDPTAGAGRQRWFDGTGWTQHVSSPAVEQPVEQFAPVYGSAAPVYGSAAPVYGSAAPAAMSFAPAVATCVTPSTSGQIVVGSMSKADVKALPRKERNSKDRPDLDLARGRNQLDVQRRAVRRRQPADQPVPAVLDHGDRLVGPRQEAGRRVPAPGLPAAGPRAGRRRPHAGHHRHRARRRRAPAPRRPGPRLDVSLGRRALSAPGGPPRGPR